MTSTLKTATTALLLALAFSASAHAQAIQGLDGHWEGNLTTSSGDKLTVILNVETKAGKTTAKFDVPEQGGKDLATNLSRAGDQVTFEVPDGQLKYVGTISADGSKITGEMGQGPIKTPVVFAHNVNTYVPPSVPAIAGLDGNWAGTISSPVGEVGVLFRISTKDGKTTGMMDVPVQGASDIPALPKRDGQKVWLDVPGVKGNFEGTLSADGKTLNGFWSQSGMDFGIELKKQ
ncbi:MAG TPA: hypothetical protein VG942_09460 [Hyphomonadaceae bacterium]|nr:hypothetical protein [Hyphomonadaceae bacterium]